MARIPPNRAIKAMQNYTHNELWAMQEELDRLLGDVVPERLEDKFGTTVVRIASAMAKKYEQYNEAYNDARYHLRYLINVCDAFGAFLPKKHLKTLLNSHFESELAGTWYELLSAAAGDEVDLRQTSPDIAEGVEARLKALFELVHKGNAEPLRQIVKVKLNLDTLPQLGRKPAPTPVVKYILEKTRELKALHKLKSRGEMVESFMEFLETHADVQAWKQTWNGKPIPALPADASLQLQAYQRFYRLDRMEGSEKLRDMERNNPGF